MKLKLKDCLIITAVPQIFYTIIKNIHRYLVKVQVYVKRIKTVTATVLKRMFNQSQNISSDIVIYVHLMENCSLVCPSDILYILSLNKYLVKARVYVKRIFNRKIFHPTLLFMCAGGKHEI